MNATRRERGVVAPRGRLAAMVFTGLALLLAAPAAVCPAQQPNVQQVSTEQVHEALYHEIYANNAQRQEQLEAALTAQPELAEARWHLGQMNIEGEWLPIEEVIAAGRNDELLAEYAERRAVASDTAADQQALAIWCQRNNLTDRARHHWQRLLDLDPESTSALRVLGLFRSYDNRIVTQAQLNEERQREQQAISDDRRWRPEFADYRRVLLEGSDAEKLAAVESIRMLEDPSCLLTLEDLFSNSNVNLALLAVEVAAKMPASEATQFLVRQGLNSRHEVVRNAAIGQLRDRSLYEFVPQLLEQLQSPLHSNIIRNQVTWAELKVWDAPVDMSAFDQRSFHVQQRILEAQQIDSSTYHLEQTLWYDSIEVSYITALKYHVSSLEQVESIEQQAEADLATFNKSILANNDPIIRLLASVTYQPDLEEPHAWWQWWQEYNALPTQQPQQVYLTQVGRGVWVPLPENAEEAELRQSELRADWVSCIAAMPDWSVVNACGQEYYAVVNGQLYQGPAPARFIYGEFGPPLPGERSNSLINPQFAHSLDDIPENKFVYDTWAFLDSRSGNRWASQQIATSTSEGFIPYSQRSCFAAGTPVWTEQGMRSIEDIQPGDRVLSQDVETGELTFKLVLDTTVNESSAVSDVVVGHESFVASPGHHFWVNGQGWKKTRDLTSGDVLHGLAGAQLVSDVVTLEEPQAVFNLIVEDDHNYFIGEARILVHDVTIHEATHAIVPGLAETQ